jgi:hypothetical protein
MEGKKKQTYIVIVVVCIMVIAAIVYLLLPGESDEMIDEDFPGNGNNGSNATVIASGTFQDGAHSTKGEALLIEMDDKMVVRLEDFKTDDGPGLYVYLSEDTGANDYISLGELKAIEGNMNYDVPLNTNTTKYNKVLIWCKPASVLFGHAELS